MRLAAHVRFLWIATVFLAACSGAAHTAISTDGGGSDAIAPLHLDAASDAPSESGAACSGASLPVVQPSDMAAATRGYAQFTEQVLSQGYVPPQALTALGIVPTTGLPVVLPGQAPTEAYWAAFRARYGFYTAPFDNGGYPMGIRIAGNGLAMFDCLTCHASVVAGQTLIGVGNSQLDLQGLFDDIAALRTLASSYGYTVPPLPFTIQGRTGAAGANDAFGLGMYLATQYDPAAPSTLHTTAGFQQPPTWWTLRFRNKMYLDGSGQAGGYRTMMATLLASGEPLTDLQAQDSTFSDIYQYLLSLEPPCWTLSTIDPAARSRGLTVFDATCASCHGVHSGPSAQFPDQVVSAASVGTDPVRAESFAPADAAWIDSTWFGGNGQAPYAMTSTGGYLAPPLAGAWATAPYFHNGSVPDLAGVLDSSQRPTRWQRTGSGTSDYDPTTVGWRYTTSDVSVGNATVAERVIYDTTLPGLSNGGHTYGDGLTDAQRSDVLEYLRSL